MRLLTRPQLRSETRHNQRQDLSLYACSCGQAASLALLTPTDLTKCRPPLHPGLQCAGQACEHGCLVRPYLDLPFMLTAAGSLVPAKGSALFTAKLYHSQYYCRATFNQRNAPASAPAARSRRVSCDTTSLYTTPVVTRCNK